MTVTPNEKQFAGLQPVRAEKSKIFYGWIVVAAGALILFSQSAVMSSFGIAIKPMADALDWSRTSVTSSFALLMVVHALLAVPFGYLTDKYGPKGLVVFGGLVGGLGMLLTSRITALWQFYLFFSVLVGMMMSASWVPLAVTVSKWFVHKRGLALGIYYSVGGVGGLALTPLMQSLILRYGWETTFVIYGVLIWATSVPAALLLKKDPSSIGLQPLGCEKAEDGDQGDASEEEGKRAEAVEGPSYTVMEAIRTSPLWMFALSTFFGRIGFSLVQINLVPYVTDPVVGIPAMTAATALGVLTGLQSAGNLAGGISSDRIGAKRTLALATLGLAVVIFGLMLVKQPWQLFVFAALFGLAVGGLATQLPRMTTWLYGAGSLGSMMGIMAISGSLGGALGPTLGSFIFDRSGSYDLAFIVAGAVSAVSFILVLILRPPRQKHAPPGSGSQDAAG